MESPVMNPIHYFNTTNQEARKDILPVVADFQPIPLRRSRRARIRLADSPRKAWVLLSFYPPLVDNMTAGALTNCLFRGLIRVGGVDWTEFMHDVRKRGG